MLACALKMCGTRGGIQYKTEIFETNSEKAYLAKLEKNIQPQTEHVYQLEKR